MDEIYNENTYSEKSPTLHIEDTKFKFQNIL